MTSSEVTGMSKEAKNCKRQSPTMETCMQVSLFSVINKFTDRLMDTENSKVADKGQGSHLLELQAVKKRHGLKCSWSMMVHCNPFRLNQSTPNAETNPTHKSMHPSSIQWGVHHPVSNIDAWEPIGVGEVDVLELRIMPGRYRTGETNGSFRSG